MLDDNNAYEYLSQNRAGCVDKLKELIAIRLEKEVEINIKKNESGQSAKDTVVDLRDLIDFDIVEENF